jgi:quinol---cytochrome-c reductase cytochrome c subunit
MPRRYLLPAALVAFVAAVGLFFSSSAAGGATRATSGTTTAPLTSPGGSTVPGSTSPGAVTEPTLPVIHRLAPLGRTLFIANCSSCHGTNAQGSSRAPNLVGLGAATVDFWVSTGRMPLAEPTAQATVKPPRFNPSQIQAIVAYVTSLGPGGPGTPAINLNNANIANGAEIFAANCAPCHTITGVGDALSAGTSAPSLYQASPTQAAEAVRIGPGQMPRFDPEQISHKQLNDLVRYVQYLHYPNDAGGGGLGHVGPVTEGFIALLVGLGAIMVVSFWIGDRS